MEAFRAIANSISTGGQHRFGLPRLPALVRRLWCCPAQRSNQTPGQGSGGASGRCRAPAGCGNSVSPACGSGPAHQRRALAGGSYDLCPPGRCLGTAAGTPGFQDQSRRPHRRRAEHGAGLCRLSGAEQFDRSDPELADGPGPLRGGGGCPECPHRQSLSRTSRALSRAGRALGAGVRFLQLPPETGRNHGGAARKPCQSTYSRRHTGRRLSGVRRASVCPYAIARGIVSGLPVRRCRRRATGQRLDSPLVAGGRLRRRDAGDDCQRPAY